MELVLLFTNLKNTKLLFYVRSKSSTPHSLLLYRNRSTPPCSAAAGIGLPDSLHNAATAPPSPAASPDFRLLTFFSSRYRLNFE
ncbi:hypothetical protein HanRHA438_Chr11g0519991 [Helianthus annuus]|nr:hypothetical protein HanXRQr2_Chr11g0507481 [Helianthus annuus]KAJ0510911.1 hypothetical protein HanIR_Chr11g0545991 [Helianthus annuus]KAJ0518686.1 hypothetical protein HanHA89_Chr11g0440231 [Helianthus annuus]KAJ0686728.1 hypothetical protein HanLR1_Chr11g0417991 [Helianthus annuus]KAJ0690530.1 hypothetical protein HanOQP8_Chr11g0418861 [Helianthus annuus]